MSLLSVTRSIAEHPLNRGHKLAALARFARWQIATRLLPYPVAMPYIGGTRVLTSRGMSGLTGSWYCGLHEPNEMGFALHALRPADLFLDVGANAGSFTVLAAGAVGARVIAVEPVPETYAVIAENILMNHLTDKVELHQCGLSTEDGELLFTTDFGPMNRIVRAGETCQSISVPVTTLDKLCADRRPIVIKIDVEGHEDAVLDGATTVLNSPDVQAVLMETWCKEVAEVLIERMVGFGFIACTYDAIARELTPRTSFSFNAVFVRDIAYMNERCKAAPRFRIVNGSI